jgi:hypothetical protein
MLENNYKRHQERKYRKIEGAPEAHDSPHFPSAQTLRRFAGVPYQIGGFGG